MLITSDMMLDALCLASFSQTEESRQVVSSILAFYDELKKRRKQVSVDPDLIILYRIVKDVNESNINFERKSEVTRILRKVETSKLAEKDPRILNEVKEILEDSSEVSDQRIAELTDRLKKWLYIAKSSDQLQNLLSRATMIGRDDYDSNEIEEVAESFNSTLDGISRSYDMTFSSQTVIDSVNLSDKNSIRRSLDAHDNRVMNNVFPSGWQALNRMLGPSHGLLRGEFALFCAPSHNFKSGMMMKWFLWCCTLSKYDPVPDGFRPCVVFVSLENEVPENTKTLAQEAYIAVMHQPPPMGMTNDELSAIVADVYGSNGVVPLMYRFGNSWGIRDFEALQDKLKARGYVVIASIIDYAMLMKIDMSNADNGAKARQYVAHSLYDYAHRHNQLIITGAQLGREAEDLMGAGQTNYVKKFGANMLRDCTALKDEADFLMFMAIEKNSDSITFLTAKWGKHRGCNQPSKNDAYFAMRFLGPDVGIIDDLDTECKAVQDIYAVKDETLTSESESESATDFAVLS